MRLVYISGAYTARDADGALDPVGIARNIAFARMAAIVVWESGDAALTPHLNTAHFETDCRAEYEDYMRGDLIMVARCDAVLMLPGWHASAGATREWAHAAALGKPIFYYPALPKEA